MSGRGRRWLLPAATVSATVIVALCTVLIGSGTVFGTATAGPAPAAPPLPVRMVGLGDSIPAAYGCDGCTGFLDIYADALGDARSTAVTVTNFAVGGWTTADLLASLTPGDEVEGAVVDPDGASRTVGQSDIVTVMIGANDYDAMVDTFAEGRCGGADGLACFDSATAMVTRDLTAILQRIRQLRGGHPTTLQVLGYWDVFPDGEFAEQAYGPQFVRDSTRVTQLANATIKDVAQAQQACYVDLYTPFKGPDGDVDDTPLLIDDGEHPNQAGHQRIADALAATACDPS
ncbi:SGNH/GDSL hydrolase family protein [Pseudonocardia sp. CA-107938]|uniref:SGNH/GDSL hydrolase family protein n=1 Tax=Pseudonocardia sp. CA-107938 TaxID=3240021 RepID=UPI003D94ED25